MYELLATGYFNHSAYAQGQKNSSHVDAGLSPGSRQILLQANVEGAIEDLIAAGVRILEASCGACVGMGFAPPTDGVSVRTINRNFTEGAGIPAERYILPALKWPQQLVSQGDY